MMKIAKKFFIIFCVFTSYGMEQDRPDLMQLILKDPGEALDRINEVRGDYYAQEGARIKSSGEDIDNSPEQFNARLRPFEKQCPVFLLDECLGDDCLLNRYNYPKIRDYFEEMVVKTMQKQLQDKPTVVYSYVGFGAGHGFEDFVILVKILDKIPHARIAINLIDPSYEPYVKSCDLLKKDRQIRSNSYFDKRKKVLKTYYDRHKISGQKQRDTLTECLYMHARYNQFLSYLRDNFPQARLSLTVHESGSSYRIYIKKKQFRLPDIIVAADIQETIDKYQNFVEDLQRQKKRAIPNFLLNKDIDHQQASIFGVGFGDATGWRELKKWDF